MLGFNISYKVGHFYIESLNTGDLLASCVHFSDLGQSIENVKHATLVDFKIGRAKQGLLVLY